MTLVYDETQLREPNLLIPRRKPVGLVKISIGHALANDLLGCWVLNRLNPINLVSGYLASPGAGAKTPSMSGGDVYFNSDHIDVNTTLPSTNGLNELTIFAIAKPTSIGGSHQMVFGNNDGQYTYLDINAGNMFFRNAYRGSATGSSSVINNKKTSFAGVIYPDGGISVFYDGVVDGNNASGSGSIGTRSTNWAIGEYGLTGGLGWVGFIDVVFIYDRALSDSEIWQLHIDPYQFLEAA